MCLKFIEKHVFPQYHSTCSLHKLRLTVYLHMTNTLHVSGVISCMFSYRRNKRYQLFFQYRAALLYNISTLDFVSFLISRQYRGLLVRTSFPIFCSMAPLEQAKPPPSLPVPGSFTRTKSSPPWCWRYTTTPHYKLLVSWDVKASASFCT